MDARFEAALGSIDAGDCAALSRQLAADPELVHVRCKLEQAPYDGYFRRATLLHHCAGNPLRGPLPENIVEIARTLLDAGADVDAATEFTAGWSWTTLGLVASSGAAATAGLSEPLIDLLLESGAELDWGAGINLYGAFYHTVECALLREVAGSLRRRGALLDLGYAAAVGDLEAMHRFLGTGEQLHEEAYSRYRPIANRLDSPTRQQILDEALVFAAMNSRVEAADLLLERGAAIDAATPVHGERPTAMHAAAWAGSVTMVRHLIDRGGNPHLRDAVHDSSTVGWAAFLNHTELHEFLLAIDDEVES